MKRQRFPSALVIAVSTSMFAGCDDEVPPAPTVMPHTSASASASPKPLPDVQKYLDAIAAEPPALSPEKTGIEGSDPATDLERCKTTTWSYYQCDDVFPEQGLRWVRHQCGHAGDDSTREIACARLGQYLLRGIGAPPQRDLGAALLLHTCRTATKQKRHNCYVGARSLMFDEPKLALQLARVGCDSPNQSPGGCRWLLPALEKGVVRREFIVESVDGLSGVRVGSTCFAWSWPSGKSECGVRFSCGGLVLHGEGGSTMRCDANGDGSDEETTSSDGDPAFELSRERVAIRDDETGRLGAFTLRGKSRQ